MKKAVTIILALLYLSISSQSLPDQIFDEIHLMNGETIHCNIIDETKKLITFYKLGDSQRYHVEKTEVSSVENRDETNIRFPREEGIIQVSEVVQAEGLTKDQLYSKARLWFAEYFRDSESVLEVEDKSSGILLGNGILTVNVPSNISGYQECNLWITLKTEFREGRYKYTINNMKYSTVDYPQAVNLEQMYTKEKIPKFFRNYRAASIDALRELLGDLKMSLGTDSAEELDKW